MLLKTCAKCGLTKTIEDFAKDACKRDGLRVYCKGCAAKRWRRYAEKNREHLRASGRRRYWHNREAELRRHKADREGDLPRYRAREKEAKRRLWRDKPAQARAYARKYYQQNKIRIRLRARVTRAFRQFATTGKTRSSDEYGIDYEAIMHYLGPPPSKDGDWQIDHVRPLASFDFDDLVQIKIAFAPENHQWLSAFANRSKGALYEP